MVALDLSPSTRHQKQARRMEACCQWPIICEREDGTACIWMQSCRDRLCPRCAHFRGLRLSTRLEATVRKWSAPKHVVLTLQATRAPLSERIDDLTKSFRRLRQTRLWRGLVRAGIYVIEVKRNTENGTWHPHLHVLMDSEYVPQSSLANQWNICSKGSRVVWIEAIHDRSRMVKYVSKYLGKGIQTEGWTDEEVCELSDGLHRRRTHGGFGKRELSQLAEEEKETQVQLQATLTSVEKVLESRKRGEVEGIRVTEFMARLGGTWALVIGEHPRTHGLESAPVTVEEWSAFIEDCRTVDARGTSAPPRPTVRVRPARSQTAPLFDLHPP